MDAETIMAPAKTRAKAAKPATIQESPGAAAEPKKAGFTHRQGQFLAFIHLYGKLHRQGPAELDMVRYFGVTPPTVHGMVVKLEQLVLVLRKQGVPRSIHVNIPVEQIPALEDVTGSP